MLTNFAVAVLVYLIAGILGYVLAPTSGQATLSTGFAPSGKTLIINNMVVLGLLLAGVLTGGILTLAELLLNGFFAGAFVAGVINTQVAGLLLSLPHAPLELVGLWLGAAVGFRGAREAVNALRGKTWWPVSQQGQAIRWAVMAAFLVLVAGVIEQHISLPLAEMMVQRR